MTKRIAGLTIWHIVAAIGIGLVVSFGLTVLQAPHPVEVHPIEITPVPTPEPVYIESTQAPVYVESTPESVDGVTAYTFLTGEATNLVILCGVLVLIVSLILAMLVSVF